MLSEVHSEVGYLFALLSEVASEVDPEVWFPMLIQKSAPKCIFFSKFQVNSEFVFEVESEVDSEVNFINYRIL